MSSKTLEMCIIEGIENNFFFLWEGLVGTDTVKIESHLCQEELPQQQPQIPRKVEVETNFGTSQQK